MASNHSDNTSASMVASDREQEDCNEVSSNGSAPTSGSKAQQKRSVKFRAWSFQLTINANLLNFTTTLQKRKLLTELLSNRAAAEKPFSVTSISTFCNESQLSGEPDSNGLVSIEVYGYVQTKNATPISVSPIKAGRIYENKLLGAASVNFILNSCADVIIQRKVHERDVHPHFVVEMSEQVSIADETVLLFHEKPRGIGTTIKQVNFWVVVMKVNLLRL